MRVLAVNAGTSSVKLSLIGDAEETLSELQLPAPGAASERSLEEYARAAGAVDAVGHRLVQGGARFREPVVVDDGVRHALEAVVDLAPLHMPPALRLLDVARALLPAVPHVACFDTGFHASLPEASYTYALPQRWRELGVRRYGFHGLSCAWSLRRASALLRRPAGTLQLVVAHLGSGASVTAIREGKSVDTSMGLTPLEGLVMATRSGSVDPGALDWLQRVHAVTADELFAALERESGLLALAGTPDMREVERRAASADADASRALTVYVHRARAQIASVASSLERLEALVFTGGVGENSATIRESICAGLTVLGLHRLSRTVAAGEDAVVGGDGGSPAVLVVHAREDVEVAREVRRALGPSLTS